MVVDMKKKSRAHGKITQKPVVEYPWSQLCGQDGGSKFFNPALDIRTTVFGAEPKMFNAKVSAMPFRGVTSLLTALRGHLLVVLAEPSVWMSHTNIESFFQTASAKQLAQLPSCLLLEGEALYIPFGWVMCVVAAPRDLELATDSTLTEGDVAMYSVDLHLLATGETNAGFDPDLCRHVVSQWIASATHIPPTYHKIAGVINWRAALEASPVGALDDADVEGACQTLES
jgi:hypothetical protein